MRCFFSIFALLGAPLVLVAQPAQVQQVPDCVIAFNLTASGQSTGGTTGFNNVGVGCNSWQIQYSASGFSGVTLAIQSAPNTSATPQLGNCTPGSWGTLGGTATFGVNPNTNTTGASSLIQSYGTSFAQCVRVSLTSATGSGNVGGLLQGFRASGTAGTNTGGGTTNVNLTQIDSIALGTDGVGLPCNLTAEVALSGTGYTQIIALSGSTVIRLCKVFVTSASAGTPNVNTLTLAYGTGSNCAAGTVELLNAAGVTGLDSDFGGSMRTAAGNAFCVKESTANADKVTATYAQY